MTRLAKLVRLRIEWWLVLAACAALLSAAVHHNWTARLDYLAYDLLLRGRERAAPQDVVIVAIDDRSLAQVGAWPWPRATQAQLVERLAQARPRAIGLDILLTEPRDPAGDARLAAAMSGAGNVYLPLAFAVPGPNGAAFAVTPPLPAFARAAAGIGHVNLSPDSDGVIRRFYRRYGNAAQAWPVLPAIMLGGRAGPAFPARLSGTQLEGAGPAMIDYLGPRGTFPTVSAVSVLEGQVPANLLAGRMILVGVTASGLGDTHATPVGGDGVLTPGVEIQANVLATLQGGTAIRPAAPALPYLFALVPLCLLFVAMRTLPPRLTGLAALALAAGIALASWALLRFGGTWLPPATALLGIAAAYPVWAWRKLAVASGYISRELERVAAEAGKLAHPAQAQGSFLDRQLALLEDTTERERKLRAEHDDVIRLLSHDMRAPQSAIVTLLDAAGDAPIGAEAAARIRACAGRTLELADGFVNLSRAELLEFAPEPLDLAELARDAADGLWPQASARGLRIMVSAPSKSEVLVAGEPSLLARALGNLIDNAVKYGAGDGTVRVMVSADADAAQVVVANDGPEIPPDRMAVLFDRFSRARDPRTDRPDRADGVGLGLAFVQTVVARHGGTIACRSAAGLTEFTVRLPLAAPE